MESQSQLEKSFFENKELFVGMDVHKAKWVVTVRTYDLELKTFSMQPQAEMLEKFLLSTYPKAKYKIVYECCFSGFWIYDYFFEKKYSITHLTQNHRKVLNFW